MVVDAYYFVYSYVKLTDCVDRRLGSRTIYLRDFLIQFLRNADRPDHYGEGSKEARKQGSKGESRNLRRAFLI